VHRQLVQVLQVVGAEATVQVGPEALGGLGRVLGDVPRDLLGRQLAHLAVGASDVADVELLAPAGIPLRPTGLNGRAGHPHSRDGQAEGVLEDGGGEALRWGSEPGRTAAFGGRVRRSTAWKWIARAAGTRPPWRS
jgi:hypothetical protein